MLLLTNEEIYFGLSISSLLSDQNMEADAVSALSSLSSSPARTLQDRCTLNGKVVNDQNTVEKKRTGGSLSLFAQAVGGVRERDKKKRQKSNS